MNSDRILEILRHRKCGHLDKSCEFVTLCNQCLSEIKWFVSTPAFEQWIVEYSKSPIPSDDQITQLFNTMRTILNALDYRMDNLQKRDGWEETATIHLEGLEGLIAASKKALTAAKRKANGLKKKSLAQA